MNDEMNNLNGQPIVEQPAQAAPAAPAKAKFDLGENKIILLIPLCIIGFIVLILLVLAIGTKTLKCKTESDIGDVTIKTVEKEKFRFGKPISFYQKTVTDYSDTDLDKKELKEKVSESKKEFKKYCKKKDGCKFSVKQSGMKVTTVIKGKYKASYRETFEEKYDSFKEYKEEFNDKCDED